MFFSTPHQGLDKDSWPTFASDVLRLSSPFPFVKPTMKMLEDIEGNSSTLIEISSDFRPLQEYLAFVNFWEGTMTRGLNRVVSVLRAIYSPPQVPILASPLTGLLLAGGQEEWHDERRHSARVPTGR